MYNWGRLSIHNYPSDHSEGFIDLGIVPKKIYTILFFDHFQWYNNGDK